jgi:hypothetical protein
LHGDCGYSSGYDGGVNRPALATAALLLLLGCATDPPPPLPVRPVDPNVIVAWTIERGIYDEGVARATEVVTVRASGGQAEMLVQDYGLTRRGDKRPVRPPTMKRRALSVAELEALEHALNGLELPDAARRAQAPTLVPWTIWGICLPVTQRKMQCGQLWVDEWNGVGGAPELFTLLQSWRQESKALPAS